MTEATATAMKLALHRLTDDRLSRWVISVTRSGHQDAETLTETIRLVRSSRKRWSTYTTCTVCTISITNYKTGTPVTVANLLRFQSTHPLPGLAHRKLSSTKRDRRAPACSYRYNSHR